MQVALFALQVASTSVVVSGFGVFPQLPQPSQVSRRWLDMIPCHLKFFSDAEGLVHALYLLNHEYHADALAAQNFAGLQ